MVTVLVSRPKPVGEALTRRLKEVGYDAVWEPILTLVPRFSVLQDAPKDAAIVFTSRLVFSVLAARRWEIEPFLSCPCYCVGSQTGAEARAFGFKKVYVGEGDGQGLVRLILSQEKEDRPLLHIGGEDVNQEVYDRLGAAGRNIIHRIVYKAESATAFSDNTIKALKERKIDAALFYSPRSSVTFAKLVKEVQLESSCSGITVVALSKAVAAPIEGLPWRRLLVASEPTEEQVLSTLRSVLPAI